MQPENSYQTLEPQRIIDTIHRLQQRIGDRFPESGLFRVCGQLHAISVNMKHRAEWIARPVFWLRALTWALCLGIVVMFVVPLVLVLNSSDPNEITGQGGGLVEFVTLLEAGINDVVLIGAALFFFLTLETRYKRQRALKAIDELRTVAHIIDMHQLTKDPHRLPGNQIYTPTDYSPRMELNPFQLRRYLDYCSEMLSLTGKVAAVYVQAFDDGVAMASASELENLTTGLSSKIWQKISILETSSDEDTPPKLQV